MIVVAQPRKHRNAEQGLAAYRTIAPQLPNWLHSSRMSVRFSQTVESADRIGWLGCLQLRERSVLRTAPERSF
jgi:hypothetical protein